MATRRTPKKKDGVHGSQHGAFAEVQAKLKNAEAREHSFLEDMLGDEYFPRHLVEKGAAILVGLCAQLEAEKPTSPAAVYALTHQATEAFNLLEEEFSEAESEIETAARDAIAGDFDFILRCYGHGHLDLEEAIAPRDW